MLQTAEPLQAGEVALAHHWMEFFRGGEAVLEQFCLLFPQAPLSVMVYDNQHLPESISRHSFNPSFLQNLAVTRRHFRKLLPFFPEVVGSMKVADTARFVFTSDASLMKGIGMPRDAVHVCYCHSPPRYLWGLEEAYLKSSNHGGWLGHQVFTAAMPRLRRFDRKVAQRVDRFIANSECVRARIAQCYDRESEVIHPPVNIDGFDWTRPREDFYLIVSALVPYKRVDLAVDACSRLGKRLVVIGTGPEMDDLQRRAAPGVEFLGWQSTAVVRDHFERCKALIFPGIEDFGITPCEAQAAGAPVVAFGDGGALETVAEGVSGTFFAEQSVDALAAALNRFDEGEAFAAGACRANVVNFGPDRFRKEIKAFLAKEYPDLFRRYDWPAA